MIIVFSVLSVLVAVAVSGFIFYLLTKRYFDNQQKMAMLQMRVDEHR